MDTVSWLVHLAVFWLVTAPILTLLHELGHALAGLPTAQGTVTAAIGSGRTPLTLRLGRLRIELRPWSGFVGMAWREHPVLSRRGEILFYAAGPLVSLLCALAALWLAAFDTILAQTLESAGYGALMQLIVTLVPVRYPSWMGAYAGHRSDGAMILRTLRGDLGDRRDEPAWSSRLGGRRSPQAVGPILVIGRSRSGNVLVW